MRAALHDRVAHILAAGLPPSQLLIAEGRAIARELVLGRSRFCREVGVASEAEYRRQHDRQPVAVFRTRGAPLV